MIRSLRLQNFKAIRDVEVTFERLTVFVGPNGSGKTSFLQGLKLLARLRLQTNWSDLNSQIYSEGYRNRYSNDDQMGIIATNQAGEISLNITPFPLEIDGKNLQNFQIATNKKPGMHLAIQQNGQEPRHSQGIPQSDPVLHSLEAVELLQLDPIKLAQPSSEAVKTIRPDGEGLPSTLAYLALNQPDAFDLIQEEYRNLVGTVKRVRFSRSPEKRTSEARLPNGEFQTTIHHIVLDELIFDLKNGTSILAQAASEGMLLVLGLLTILMSNDSDRPNLILIDDLDRGLHPLAQRSVINLLRKILEQQPNLQIVATTHSPYLVDCLQPEEVRMTTLNDDGTVACGRLVDHPKFAKWKDEMAPGELWSLFGEKWVTQSPPTTEAI